MQIVKIKTKTNYNFGIHLLEDTDSLDVLLNIVSSLKLFSIIFYLLFFSTYKQNVQ